MNTGQPGLSIDHHTNIGGKIGHGKEEQIDDVRAGTNFRNDSERMRRQQ